MKQGFSRFEYYLLKLEQLMFEAVKHPSPAAWLFENNARTPLFMLEGLAKAYAGMSGDNLFTKLKERFKILEDALGRIDYYHAFALELKDHSTTPPLISSYLALQAEMETKRMNDLLTEHHWIGDVNDRFRKIRKKLEKADWKKPAKECKQLQEFYLRSMQEIQSIAVNEVPFNDVETQVHAIRRKLRWLSIYPQAFQGMIQLTADAAQEASLAQYLVPEIINSPFNKMPDAGENTHFLMLGKNHFLAMSWMIAELGKLKDEGLRIIAVAEALEISDGLTEQEARAKASDLLAGQRMIPDILKRSDEIVSAYTNAELLKGLNPQIAEII